MKAILHAKPLAVVLDVAAGLVNSKMAAKIAALGAAHLVAGDDAASITVNVLDFALTTTIPAAVESAGELAVSAPRLASLAASFAGGAEIVVAAGDKGVQISCGRSHFKLPLIPVTDLPPTPKIDNEIGRIELERLELLALLSKPAFAMSAEKTHYYLTGTFLHDTDAGVAAVATDGYRLGRAVLPGAGLSQDRRLIVPERAIKILLKLLTNRAIGKLTLRRSSTLLEITAGSFTFTTKLIDGAFPHYERILPSPTGNSVVVGRAELLRAFARIEAVAPGTKAMPLVGLHWTAGSPALHVVVPGWPDLADDLIAAETSGTGRVAFKVFHGLELLGALKGDRVRIDAGSTLGGAILITDPQDADFTIIQMPCVWGA